jgi:hypothetical protein
MIYFIYTDGEKKKNKKDDDRQRNRYDGERETRGKRLFLLYDLETEESVVFMIDQHKKKEKEHVLYILQVLDYM